MQNKRLPLRFGTETEGRTSGYRYIRFVTWKDGALVRQGRWELKNVAYCDKRVTHHTAQVIHPFVSELLHIIMTVDIESIDFNHSLFGYRR